MRFTVSLLILTLSLSTVSATAAPKTRPYTSAELQEVETPVEGKIRAIRDQEVKQLKLALSRRNPENRRADLFFRL